MSKKKQILKDLPKGKENSGRHVSNGTTDGSKYEQFLTSMGMDRKTIMKEFEEANTGNEWFDKLKRRAMALEFYTKMNEITSDFYNNTDKRSLSLNAQLQQIDADLREHRMAKEQNDPTYSVVDDKQYQKWLAMRVTLMAEIRKQQMELAKMSLDKDTDVKAEDIDWENM